MIGNFKFLNIAELPRFENALIGRVPARISDSTALLKAVASALSFPAYFGENWNALYDCLRDFHWTDKRSVVLVHEDVPQIPEDEFKIYLEVLKDAATDWKAGEPHELIIVFDDRSRGTVIDALMG
jgi:RNAse (barnase) inhibitor barstar